MVVAPPLGAEDAADGATWFALMQRLVLPGDTMIHMYKERVLVDNCRLRSVLLAFKHGCDLHRIQLSFAILMDGGVDPQDHSKLIYLSLASY